MRNKSGIYAIVNLKTDKMYIGSSKNIASRLQVHKNNLLKGIHPSIELQKDFTELGKEYFKAKLIEECTENLFVRERFHIENNTNLYNQIIPHENGGSLFVPDNIRDRIRQRNAEERLLNPEKHELANKKSGEVIKRLIQERDSKVIGGFIKEKRIKSIDINGIEIEHESISKCARSLGFKVIKVQEVLRGKKIKGNGIISNCNSYKGYKFEFI